MKLNLTITPKARQQLDNFLPEGQNWKDTYLYLGVQPGGCSGATYDLQFTQEKQPLQEEVLATDVRVLIDPSMKPLLMDLTIDYNDALVGGGFKIDNPNATTTCGCGKSFGA